MPTLHARHSIHTSFVFFFNVFQNTTGGFVVIFVGRSFITELLYEDCAMLHRNNVYNHCNSAFGRTFLYCYGFLGFKGYIRASLLNYVFEARLLASV